MNQEVLNIALRPVDSEADDEFLKALYFDRRDDLKMLQVDEAMKQNLLEMQYQAFSSQTDAEFPAADKYIVLLDDVPIGCYILDRREDEIFGVDLSILSEYRSRGIGAQLIRETMAEGSATGRPFRYHVDLGNRAKRLYERLGFAVVGNTPTNFEMEWRPSGETK